MKKIQTILAILILPLFLNGQDLIPFKSNSLWGYKDSLGTIVIEPDYQRATRFQQQYAVIVQNNLFGAIDKSNNIVIPPKHKFLKYIGNEYFLFGSPAKYFGEFNLGIITSKNEILISPEFKHVHFKNDNFVVKKESYIITDSDGIYDTRKVTNKYGLIDTLGNVVLEPIYGRIKFFTNGYVGVNLDINGYSALLDKSFKQLTEFEYHLSGDFHDDLLKVRNRSTEKYGYLNLKGQEEIECKFDINYLFIDGYAMVRKDDQAAIINTKDEVIVEYKYKGLGIPYKSQLTAFDGSKKGMINLNGDTLLSLEYEKTISELRGITAFLKDKKWRVWSYESESLLPVEYDEIKLTEGDINTVLSFGKIKKKKYSQSLAFVRVKENWGIINHKGEVLVPINFEKKELYSKIKKM